MRSREQDRFTTTKTLYLLYICCLFCYWYINDLIGIGDTCAQSCIIAEMCLPVYSVYKVVMRHTTVCWRPRKPEKTSGFPEESDPWIVKFRMEFDIPEENNPRQFR